MSDADEKLPTPRRRRRSAVSRWLLPLLLLCVVATACGSSAIAANADRPAAAEEASVAPVATAPPSSTEPAPLAPTAEPTASETATATPEPASTPTPHPIALADTELPSAPVGFEDLFQQEPAGPAPISIEIENINVTNAAIIPVGVNEDLTFEVPPADQVGWYEFGSAPGEAGSAVLAAHIAFDGVDGVFRYLEDVEIGSIVVVGFDDGTSARYRIEEVTEYVKEALPDSLWARDGKEQLALITCGGNFNYQLDSYESNTVVIAVPA